MTAPFRDNVVIITGASVGIGREMALQLADQGAWLALAARSAPQLEEVAEECRQRGGRAMVVGTDVADEQQCKALIDATLAEYGRLDTLINNAGITLTARFDEMRTLEPFDTVMRVNYLGSVYCTHYALPHLKEAKGRIVGVASLTGKFGVPERTGYAASKHAMAGFFDSLRIELAGSGVTVTMVYPSYVATGVRRQGLGADGKPTDNDRTNPDRIMQVDTCARLVIKAAAARRRQLVMTAKGKFGQWLRLIAPGLVDWLAVRAVEKGK